MLSFKGLVGHLCEEVQQSSLEDIRLGEFGE